MHYCVILKMMKLLMICAIKILSKILRCLSNLEKDFIEKQFNAFEKIFFIYNNTII